MSAATLNRPFRHTSGRVLSDNKLFPSQEISHGRYIVRFARSNAEVLAAMQVRYEVFNLELGAGRASSFLTGLDYDEFDSTAQHLILIDRVRRQVIGTYRMRTYEIAKTIQGFHSSQEFDLTKLPTEVLANAIEVGRLCITKAQRNSHVHMVLWKGLGLGLKQNDKRYVFGAVSLSTQDPMEAGRIFDQLNSEGHLHPEFRISPKIGFKCLWYKMAEGRESKVAIPSWFRACLRLGTKLCGPPAINRQFRTIDFPVILDVVESEDRARRVLLGI